LLIDAITKDLFELKKELRNRRIKIWEGFHTDMVIYHHYVVRGYQYKFGIVREVLKAQMEIRLGEYVQKIMNKMK
jgi:hypothetical protein